jgi:superfamily II RNA helicase
MPVICSAAPVDDPLFTSLEVSSGIQLSDFQKHAIKAIVDGHHVLVCAPTGSGKTLPAEFAIRHFINQGKRVIYTSPIKALSNQKYHDFSRKFPDISVGLCTGDIKTNPTADLLIMTAEILNNRLFQMDGNESRGGGGDLSFEMNLNTELAAVVMDEVHYINDESRGHVWEQTIMTLPKQVQMIMLSATLDGPEAFAKWVEDSRGNSEKRVYLAQTHKRIVPLSHYAFFPIAPDAIVKATKSTPLEPVVKTQTNKLITLQTSANKFQSPGYKTVEQLSDIWADTIKGPASKKHVLNSLATFMKGSDDPDIDDTMLPAIVFLFSRKQVEQSAQDLTANILAFDSKIPYNAARECEQIVRRLPNWREYVELPEYKTLVALLEKGVGIHHSGMIPVLREIVELMISQKKIFFLFATESFAIGLDCPIRTAVFTGITKWDGSSNRHLYAHEYAQMAGRAGRRGIDTIGHVVHLPLLFKGGIPSEIVYKEVLSGKPQTLVSKFHVDYNMVLSLLKKGINADFHLFAERSMSKNSILGESEDMRKEIEKSKVVLAEKRAAANHIRTPKEVCTEYEGLLGQIAMANNKKRKELDRKMTALKSQHKYIVEDLALLDKVRALEQELVSREREQGEIESYLKTQTDNVCSILLNRRVIKAIESRTWELTDPLGILSSNLRETHPVPLAELVLKTGWFSSWTAKQIVGLLSVFLDVRVPEEMRSLEPSSKDGKIFDAIIVLRDAYDELRRDEIALGSYTGISYEGALCFDMTEIMMEWCELSDELACKQFLTELRTMEISTGDFTKSCMKLSAITKELASMCESFPGQTEAIGLMRLLSDVDGLILKSVATTQSLYL